MNADSVRETSKIIMGELRQKWPFLAALGAGCLVGASGIILVQRLSHRIDHYGTGNESISKELTSLHVTIKDLQDAIRELKEGKSERPLLKSALRSVTFAEVEKSFESRHADELDSSSRNNNPVSTTSSTFHTVASTSNNSEYFSAISSDEDDYFDLKDEEVDEAPNDKVQILSESDVILELFRVVDDLCVGDEKDQAEALNLLRTNEEDLSENSEFLWRFCKAIYLNSTSASITGDQDLKKELIFEAVNVGRRSINCAGGENDCQCSEAHKWYAIAVGSRGEFLGIKEKILDGFEFKKHVDKASKLAPDDHTIQHLLGRFCFEVAELSWFERKMASTLFAEPPLATMEEARDHFLAAEKIKSDGWVENRLFLAKALIKLNDFANALEWLDKAADLPVKNQDDRQAHDDVLQLLEEYQQHRSNS